MVGEGECQKSVARRSKPAGGHARDEQGLIPGHVSPRPARLWPRNAEEEFTGRMRAKPYGHEPRKRIHDPVLLWCIVARRALDSSGLSKTRSLLQCH